MVKNLYGPHSEKTCLQDFANNTDADQPAHALASVLKFCMYIVELLYFTDSE